MGNATNNGVLKLFSNMLHIDTHKMLKFSTRKRELTNDIHKIETMRQRAIDNVNYSFDVNGDGDPDSIAGRNFEIEQINKECDQKLASYTCEENTLTNDMTDTESRISFEEATIDTLQNMADDSAKSFGIFGK